MTLFDNMLGGLHERYAVVALSILAIFIALAVVAWRCSRRETACRPQPRTGKHMVEQRAWDFCPVCGRPKPTDGAATPPKPQGLPTRDAITYQVSTVVNDNPSPYDLLRRGWTRAAAVDAQGRIVTPCWPTAVAWSIWGAVNRAYEPGGEVWKAAHRHLTDIIAEREGGCTVSAQRWNRAAGRSHSEILSVADEVQRRLAFEPRP